MRILLTSSMFATPRQPEHGGGSAVVAEMVWRAMTDLGHEVAVIRDSPPATPDEQVGASTVHAGAKWNLFDWRDAGAQNPFSKLARHLIEDRGGPARNAVALLDSFRPDVVASHNPLGIGTGLWTAAAARGIPVVHTLHDYYLLCPRVVRRKGDANCATTCASCRWLTQARRHRTGQLSGVIGVSRYVLDIHEKAGLFGATCDRRVILNSSASRPRQGDDFEAGRPLRIGFIGRGSTHKGLPVLIEAFERMGNAASRLLIAGEVEEDASRRIAQTRRRAEIDLLGFRDPASFYDQVDIVVVPSIWQETFSLAVSEAKAHGLAVVGSEIGGIPEALGGADHGWLSPPGDAAALARLLDDISRQPDLLRTKAHAAFESARRWAPADFGRAYEAAYADAVERKKASAG